MIALPRVSDILKATGLAQDFSGIPAADLEMARQRGIALHRLAEADHYAYLDPADIQPEVAPYFHAYLKFVAEKKHVPIISEFEVISTRWGFCGHPDRLAWHGTRRVLCDWKTGDSLDLESVALQLCAYKLAFDEQHPTELIHETFAVQFRSDATYRLHPIDTGPSMHIWQAAVIVFRSRRQRRAA